MSRAIKRKSRREAKKAKKAAKTKLPEQSVDLINPQSHNFDQFIFGNSLYCERVVEPEAGKGKTLVIAGAGPSLADHAHEYCEQADEVWGCNSAATWLYENGHKVTHAFTVDQTPHMIEEWLSAPPIEYLLASSVHPHLVEYLLEKKRTIRFFHNFVGIKKPPITLCGCGHMETDHPVGPCLRCDCEIFEPCTMGFEQWLYALFYPRTVIVGSGLNATTRATELARFMGFDKVWVLGADCALRLKKPRPDAPFGSPEHMKWLKEDTIMHADGGSAVASEATPVTMYGEIDGRPWETKPDLVVTAVWLVKMARAWPWLELIGDTLPNALMDKDDDFLDRLPSLTDGSGETMRIEIDSEPLDTEKIA